MPRFDTLKWPLKLSSTVSYFFPNKDKLHKHVTSHYVFNMNFVTYTYSEVNNKVACSWDLNC